MNTPHRSVRVPDNTCGCGHAVLDHKPDGYGPCEAWWSYPDVLDPRQCGCIGVWLPATHTES